MSSELPRSSVWGRYGHDLVVMVGLFVALAAVQWVLRSSPRPDDPTNYFRLAGAFSGLDGTVAGFQVGQQASRFGVLIPVAIGQRLFGYSEAAYYALPMAAYAGLGVATYALARIGLGRVLAVAATGLACLTPFMLESSSHPLPDLPAAAGFTVGMALLLGASRWPTSARAADGFVIASGLAFGYAYTCKVTVLLLAPIVLLTLWIDRPRRRHVLLLVSAFLAVVAAEVVLLGLATGEPFGRIGVLLNRTSPRSVDELTAADFAKIEATARSQGTLVGAATVFPRMLLRSVPSMAPATAALLAAPVAAAIGWWRSRHRVWLVVLGWAVLYWAALTLLGTVRTEAGGFVLRIVNDRYWLPIVPALAIGVLGAFAPTATGGRTSVWGRVRGPLGAALVVALLAYLVPATTNPSAELHGAQPHLVEFRDWWAAEQGAFDVIHSGFSLPVVRLFTTSPTGGRDPWQGDYRSLSRPLADHGVIVLSNDSGPLHPTIPLRQKLGDGTRVALSTPPLDWALRMVASDRRLAVLDPSGSPATEVSTTSDDPRTGIPVPALPPGTSVLRVRLVFRAQGRGALLARCEHPAYSDGAVLAWTAAARTWWKYGAGEGPFEVDFFCPVVDGGERGMRVTVDAGPTAQGLQIAPISTTFHAQRAPSHWPVLD